MKIGPKYKIARRLGAHLFDKTQGPKFAEAKSARREVRGRPGSGTNFGLQLLEKQRVRFSYGIPERQFKRYVNEVIKKKGKNQIERLYQKLETRLDNAVYRMGLARSRMASRQFVSHGHIIVNGKRVTIPSYNLGVGDKVSIREGSRSKGMFAALQSDLKEKIVPEWLKFNVQKIEAEVASLPPLPTQGGFDLSTVIEFYRR